MSTTHIRRGSLPSTSGRCGPRLLHASKRGAVSCRPHAGPLVDMSKSDRHESDGMHATLKDLARRTTSLFLAGAIAISTAGPAAAALQPSQVQAIPVIDAATRATTPSIPKEFPALPELKAAEYQDHEVPIVRGTLVFKGGAAAEPEDKSGLVQIMTDGHTPMDTRAVPTREHPSFASLGAALQRSGGSVSHPSLRLEEELDAKAAEIETSSSEAATSVGFKCLREDAQDVLALTLEVARTPAFPEERLEILRTQALEAIAHRNDSASGIPARELRKLLYGPLSPYAKQPTRATVKSISREDIQAFHDKWQRPDAAYLGIVGDFNSKAMRKTVEATFGSWKPADGQPKVPPKLPQVPVPFPRPGVAPDTTGFLSAGGASVSAVPPQCPAPIYLVNRPGAATTSVAFGELGVSVKDKDATALDVANMMLNSFGGRLFTEVRSKRGLSYSVQGRWLMEATYDGVFVVAADTDRPAELITRTQQVLRKLADELPPKEEVEAAKGQALNSFAFNFSSKAAQMARVISYDLYGIDKNFLFKVQKEIQQQTPESIRTAVRAHLHIDQQPIVVAGDARRIQADLEKLGRPVVPLRPE